MTSVSNFFSLMSCEFSILLRKTRDHCKKPTIHPFTKTR
jgi:hypothetical protein